MRAIRTLTLAAACTALCAAAGVAQQAGSAASANVSAEAQWQAEEIQLQRAEVRRLLARPEVRKFAQARGYDVQRAEGAVEVLGNAELQQIAPLARRANEHFAAGGAIVISTTTVIIALLILILIILIT